MHIEIDTNNVSQLELQALSALIAVLSGRPAPALTHGEMDGDVFPLVATTTGIAASGPASPSTNSVPTPPADESDDDAANAAGAPATDSAGIPWDERIHSASRATVADGTWRRRKNTPDATYDAVMAELRGQAAPNGAGASTSATPAPSTDDTPPPPVEPAVTVSAADAATTAADVPPPPATDGPDLSTFPKFVQAVNGKDVPAERKTYQALNELCSTFGVAAFKDMKDRPNDWAMFYDMVG